MNNVTIHLNRAVGGSGNTAGTFGDTGIGGGMANNGANINAPVSSGSTVTLLDSSVDHNQAVGGDVGDGLGSGMANLLGGVTTILGGTITHNHAEGDGGITGGNALGGSVYSDATSTHSSNLGASTILTVSNATLTRNMALGGDGEVNGGDGFGGGLHSGGNASISASIISYNHANGEVGGTGGNDGGRNRRRRL